MAGDGEIDIQERDGLAPDPGVESGVPDLPRYRFGDFELDLVARTLTRDGEEIRLAPRVFALLEHLVRNAGAAQSRDDLLDVVWPGVAVSDQSLTEAIWRLRRALDDDPRDPVYIATLPGHGFRFVAPVENGSEPDPAPEPPRVPLWKLALPGAVLSGLLLAVLMAGAFLEAGPSVPTPLGLFEVMVDDEQPVLDYRALLSPDTTRLAFAQSDPARLQVLDMISGEITVLGMLDRVWNGRSYAWSSDGAMLAFGDRPQLRGAGRLETFEIATGARTVLAENPDELYAPVGWGPDDELLLTLVFWPGHVEKQPWDRIRLLDRQGATRAEWRVATLGGARVSPDGRWLAIARHGEAGGELVVVPIEAIWNTPEQLPDDHFTDLSRWGRITDPPCVDDPPFWSPMSDRLAFFSFRQGERDLWTVPLVNGRPVTQPEPMRVPGDPYMIVGWTPDGRLLFRSLRSFLDVAAVQIDERATRVVGPVARMSRWAAAARAPLWSSDPEHILFKSQRDEQEGDLYLAPVSFAPDAATIGTQTRISVDGHFRAAAWTPEGDRVYFLRFLQGDEGPGQGLFTQDLETGEQTRLLPEHRLLGAPHALLAGQAGVLLLNTWVPPRDPDRATLAQGQYLYDPEGGSLRQIDDSSPYAGAISPDASLVALTSEDLTEIRLLHVEEGSRRLVVTVAEGWQLAPPYAFSPDGDRLAYIVERRPPEDLCTRSEVWIVDTAGGPPRRLEGAEGLGVNDLSWSLDGRRLAFGLYDCQGSVFVYEP